MTPADLKLEIEKALKKTNSPAVLELVYTILNGENISEGKRISRMQYNKELNAAMQQTKEGKWMTHEDVVKRMEKFK
jgi:hypothetical protein